MLLNTLLITGLASLAAALPHVHAKRFENAVGERGAEILGRQVPSRDFQQQNRNGGQQGRRNQDIVITQVRGAAVLTSTQVSSDFELIQLVQERIIIIDQTQRNRDNIRRNHFANLYNTVNTVIIIVTPVIDERNQNNRNTRYMARRINSNVQSREQVVVVIQESQAIIINIDNRNGNGRNGNGQGNRNGNGNGQGNRNGRRQEIPVATPAGVAAAQSTGTVGVTPNVLDINPNSMSAVTSSNSSNSMLLPAGIPLPNFGGMQVIQDPAIILESNQRVSVSFADQQQQAASIINISSGAAGVTIISA